MCVNAKGFQGNASKVQASAVGAKTHAALRVGLCRQGADIARVRGTFLCCVFSTSACDKGCCVNACTRAEKHRMTMTSIALVATMQSTWRQNPEVDALIHKWNHQ